MRRFLPIVALLAVQATAQAGFVEISLTEVRTGDTPAGPAPWLTARFEDTAVSGQVQLTLTSLLTNGNFLKGSTNNPALSFNLNPVKSAAGLVFVGQSGNLADQIVKASNSVTPSPAAAFDFGFNWDKKGTGGWFDGSETAIYLLTIGGGGLVAADFDFTNADGYFSFAHVQGTSGREGSGKIFGDETDGGGGGVVPEPSGLAFGIFAIGSILVAQQRRRFPFRR